MKISVVLGTHNRLEALKRCLQSIFEQSRSAVRVYVTDAGSTDGTVEYLKSSAGDQLVPILLGERIGQARAYNQVFEVVETPYVAWLSDDNVVVNCSLDLASSILEEHPRIGMVGLKVKDVMGPFADAPYLGAVSAIGVLNVNQGMLRTSVLREVGAFSEAFRDYGIDPDLTTKVLLTGNDIVYTRDVALYHYRAWADDPEITGKFRERHRRHLDLYWKKYRAFGEPDPRWRVKLVLWKLFWRVFRVNMNSNRMILGMVVRDWCNILTGRYVSLFDPFVCGGRPFHLYQSCPPSQRLRHLPSDPIDVSTEPAR